MALQASGAISFLNIQTEFGGESPIGINEYYRDGIYVPSFVIESVPDGSEPDTFLESDGFFYRYESDDQVDIDVIPVPLWSFQEIYLGIDGWNLRIYWNTSLVYDVSGTGIGSSPVSVVTGGYTYHRGQFRSTYEVLISDPGQQFEFATATYSDQYGVRRAFAVTANQSIPTSGQISADQFYNGRKT